MTSDYNIAILSVIKIIVENNAGCVARKLKEVGYETKVYIPTSELEAALFQLHSANRNLFFKVMKNCEWNNGNNNWTNNPQYKEQILSAVSKYTGTQADKLNWWNATMDYLNQQSVN